MRNYLLVPIMVLFLMGNTSCTTQQQDQAALALDSGAQVINIVSETDMEGTTLEKVKNAVESAAKVTGIVTTAVPVAAPITGPLTLGLGILASVLTLFTVKQRKDIKVERQSTAENKALADDYRDGIEAGLTSGDDPNVLEATELREVFDTKTKTHFNATGLSRL